MKKEYIIPELEVLDLRVEGRILDNISGGGSGPGVDTGGDGGDEDIS